MQYLSFFKQKVSEKKKIFFLKFKKNFDCIFAFYLCEKMASFKVYKL